MTTDHEEEDVLEDEDDWFSELYYDREVESQDAEERLGRYFGGVLHDDYSEESNP